MNAKRFNTVAEFATAAHACLYFGEHGDWFMVAGQHRESDSLTRSNFTVLVERLEKADPEGDGFTVERFSCSLVGWRDHLLVAPHARRCLRVAVAAARDLDVYPVLDEDHWSLLEWEEASEWWEQESDSFRLDCCKECGIDAAAADCDCLADALRFDPHGRLYEYLMCLALIILLVAGCGRAPDERLAEFAQQSMIEQRRQNARLADQSQAVVAESHQLAEAAKELVTRDAQARRELIAGHDRLEQDRRQIAAQRHRDPIIAAVIQNFGLVIACLLPLVVAVLVIRQMQSQEPDHAAVAELLTLELTSKAPRLLPGPRLLPRPGPRRPELTCDEQAYHEWMTGDPPQASDPTI